MNGKGRLVFLVIASLLFLRVAGHAQQGVHTPSPGDPERKAIMDVMRLDFYRNDPSEAHRNPDGVFFKVQFLKVHGDWALAYVLPIAAAGKDVAEPRWGLLHRKAGKWLGVDYFAALTKYELLHPTEPQLGDFDLLDLSDLAIRKLLRALPDIPKDIFPDHGKQHP